MKNNLVGLLVLVLALAGANVWALSTDREKPIEIEADAAERDESQGVTIYTGDVVIVQGTMKILGDVVTIYFSDDQDIIKVVAEGEPAKFEQLPDGDVDVQNAQAKTLEFHAGEDIIVLLGNAVSWQGESRMEAEKIVYDTRSGKVKADSTTTLTDADSSDSGTGRVKITIPPKKKKTQDE
jgi:lipopolysaccharide export system protein LptA